MDHRDSFQFHQRQTPTINARTDASFWSLVLVFPYDQVSMFREFCLGRSGASLPLAVDTTEPSMAWSFEAIGARFKADAITPVQSARVTRAPLMAGRPSKLN